VIDVEVVELAGRAIALELPRIGANPGPIEQLGQDIQMLGAELLLDAIGAEALNGTAHKQPRFVNGIAEAAPGIAAYDEVARWAMNALIWPTDPPTTISAPFMEIPQREEVSPSITNKPPRADAPADCEALPRTRTKPDIMFSATPGPACPLTTTSACLFMPAQ